VGVGTSNNSVKFPISALLFLSQQMALLPRKLQQILNTPAVSATEACIALSCVYSMSSVKVCKVAKFTAL